ncbi:MAG: BrnA antitoxin family protein [Gemmobacter sp.]
MSKNGPITRITAEEAARLAKTESRTDWARVGAMTGEEIEADRDEDEEGMVIDWASAVPGLPEPKSTLNMRIDRDVLDFFRQGGRGYQTRINAVLRAYKEAQSRG